ncbi:MULTISPECIES: methyltransferase domain-containing protein [unclassified Polynucleobacter]|jgi:SAM-dependent methyltransferase|uniref:class I SAM-dependent methyltransferase n=1 Tax=unclassified Polynucleobacter TaxID=2640945 RepID=UPI000BDD1A05|nr:MULTISPECIES: methyltransferase domain-containing protein [unclassified Polynucleobacter]OYY14139.1 MAG: SAM-dependent methyltransferase [Polynucleobacter sp. 35-46-11]OZA75413.1 MAG: SAM-dependent methyltransferase [Polynucleobacter sp. 39-46-10]
MKKFLHVGCGPQNKTNLRGFDSSAWSEVRFDIDPKVSPDIQGTLIDMSLVQAESMDALYSSHNIEHIFPHEVPVALAEFYRVLKPDGFVVITCPDLQSVCEAVASDNLLSPLYNSPAGPIAAIDILYGHRGYISDGNHFMAHKCGFTYSALGDAFLCAGFKEIYGGRRPASFDLWLVAFKNDMAPGQSQEIASTFLP